jgi:hypothetical protein
MKGCFNWNCLGLPNGLAVASTGVSNTCQDLPGTAFYSTCATSLLQDLSGSRVGAMI